ncbi:MAG: hypothetical protein ACFFD1_08125, partial [Candidatus Thorarchaeota archaeon]
NYSLQVVWIVLQLVVAIFLLVKMFKTKRYNLIPLILFLIFSSVRIIFLVTVPALRPIYLVLVQFPNLLLVIFTKLTFFRYRKSPFMIFVLILIFIRTVDFIIRLNFNITVPMTRELSESDLLYYYYILFSISISYLLSHGWLGFVSIRYYWTIRFENIAPWIRKRYRLIAISSLIYCFSIVIYFLFPYHDVDIYVFPNIIYSYILVGLTIFYSIGMFIAWIMPQKLKRYFDKDFQPSEEKEFTEEELMERINRERNISK